MLRDMDFYLFQKNVKKLSSKYGQKFFDTTKKSATYALKIALKRALQKTAHAIGDLVENNSVDKITSVTSRKSSRKSTEVLMPAQTVEVSMEILRLLYSLDYCNNYDYIRREIEYQKIINLLTYLYTYKCVESTLIARTIANAAQRADKRSSRSHSKIVHHSLVASAK